ncbi:MAG: hypothetical protein JRH20_08215, partial [Deltaproteobacteria bacterium]|nr:hypothetical protein [Deltaproteobacteria bacterium]
MAIINLLRQVTRAPRDAKFLLVMLLFQMSSLTTFGACTGTLGGPATQIEMQTQNALTDLRIWLDRYTDASPKEAQGMESDGKQLVALHRELVKQLASADPRMAHKLALPARFRASLPSSLQNLAAVAVTGTGKLLMETLEASDFLPNGTDEPTKSVTRHIVEINEHSYEVGSEHTSLLGMPLGTTLPIHAVVVGRSLYASTVTAFDASKTRSQSRTSYSSSPGLPTPGPFQKANVNHTFGMKKVMFVTQANTSDIPRATNASAKAYAESVEKRLNTFYGRNSRGAISFQVTAMPVVFDAPDLSTALVKLKKMGYNKADYDLGVAVGGPHKRMSAQLSGFWVYAFPNMHEFGHVLGLHHSNKWKSSTKDPIGPGHTGEYAGFGTMASSGSSGGLNVWERYFLNWMTDEELPVVEKSGTYVIQNRTTSYSEETRGQVFGIRIPKGVGHYVIDYQPFLQGDRWVPYANLYWGSQHARFYSRQDYIAPFPHLINNGMPISHFLSLGLTFSDKIAGIHITPVAATESTITIKVVLGHFDKNRPPIISRISSDRDHVASGDKIDVAAHATDPDGDQLSYFWSFHGLNNSTGRNVSRTLRYMYRTGKRPFAVSVIVSDGRGGMAMKSMALETDTWKEDPSNPADVTPPDVSVNATRILRTQGPVTINVKAADANGIRKVALHTGPAFGSLFRIGLKRSDPGTLFKELESGPFSFKLDPSFFNLTQAGARRQVSIDVWDKAGNRISSEPFQIEYGDPTDKVPPRVVFLQPTPGQVISRSQTSYPYFPISFKIEVHDNRPMENTFFEMFVDGAFAEFEPCYVRTGTHCEIDGISLFRPNWDKFTKDEHRFAEGNHTLSIRGRDVAGNLVESSVSFVYDDPSTSDGPKPTPPPADKTPPMVPDGLSATAQSETTANVSWHASSDAGGLRGYELYRDSHRIAELSAGSTSYVDSALTAGTTYHYEVLAVDRAGNRSAKSAPVTVRTNESTSPPDPILPAPPKPEDKVPPTVPTEVRGLVLGYDQVRVQWASSTDLDGAGVQSYEVFRDGKLIRMLDAKSVLFVDSGLNPSTAYRYQIR